MTIKREPRRIVSLDPTATEDLYAMGAGTQVVAVDQDSDYPPGAPVTSLSGLTPDIEAIAKYNPSLVIASQNSGGLVSGLAKLGVPVLIEPAVATLSAAYQQIEQIGQATGHYNQATEVVRNMREEINDAVQQVGAKYRGGPTTGRLSDNPYYSATSATFIGHILDLFGLKNIADAAGKPADGGYPELSGGVHRHRQAAAHLPGRQPGRRRRPDPGVVARRPGWAAMPAVQDSDIFGLNDDIASRWGPRVPALVNGSPARSRAPSRERAARGPGPALLTERAGRLGKTTVRSI